MTNTNIDIKYKDGKSLFYNVTFLTSEFFNDENENKNSNLEKVKMFKINTINNTITDATYNNIKYQLFKKGSCTRFVAEVGNWYLLSNAMQYNNIMYNDDGLSVTNEFMKLTALKKIKYTNNYLNLTTLQFNELFEKSKNNYMTKYNINEEVINNCNHEACHEYEESDEDKDVSNNVIDEDFNIKNIDESSSYKYKFDKPVYDEKRFICGTVIIQKGYLADDTQKYMFFKLHNVYETLEQAYTDYNEVKNNSQYSNPSYSIILVPLRKSISLNDNINQSLYNIDFLIYLHLEYQKTLDEKIFEYKNSQSEVIVSNKTFNNIVNDKLNDKSVNEDENDKNIKKSLDKIKQLADFKQKITMGQYVTMKQQLVNELESELLK